VYFVQLRRLWTILLGEVYGCLCAFSCTTSADASTLKSAKEDRIAHSSHSETNTPFKRNWPIGNDKLACDVLVDPKCSIDVGRAEMIWLMTSTWQMLRRWQGAMGDASWFGRRFLALVAVLEQRKSNIVKSVPKYMRRSNSMDEQQVVRIFCPTMKDGTLTLYSQW
jgi:hypothetical protein